MTKEQLQNEIKKLQEAINLLTLALETGDTVGVADKVNAILK